MFFIPVALLLCVTSAIAGLIPPGDYIITNVQYHGAVCAFDSFNPIFVCREPRPPFDIVSLSLGHFSKYTIAIICVKL